MICNPILFCDLNNVYISPSKCQTCSYFLGFRVCGKTRRLNLCCKLVDWGQNFVKLGCRNLEKKEKKIYEWMIGFRDVQTQANLRILALPTAEKIRKYFAIYRLYRYCDFPIAEMIDILHLHYEKIQEIIGDVFKLLCESDDKCVFKRFLEVS